MTEWIRFGLSAISMLLGVLMFVVGIIGTYRYRFVMNRMHAAALLDTMGLFFVILSLSISRGFSAISIKLWLIVLFLWISSPIASHLLAKMEFFTDETLSEEINNDYQKENDNVSSDL